MIALTTGQRLVFAIVALIFVVTMFVWPVIRHQHRSDSVMDKHRSHNRLLRELHKHDD